MKKLKIAEINDTYYPHLDGVCTVINNYAELLNVTDDCEVIAPKFRKYVDDFSYDVFRVNSFYVPIAKITYSLPLIDPKLKKHLMETDFDILHIHSPLNLGKFAIDIAKKKNIPVVATMHTKFRDDFKKFMRFDSIADFATGRVAKVFERVDELWTVNNNMVGVLKEYGCNKEPIVMPNATEYVFPSNVDKLIERVNETYHLAEGEIVLTFVGQITYQKNLKLILESAKILKQKNIKVKLLLVGFGFDFISLNNYAKSLGIAENVIFTNNVYDRELLSGIYLRSSLFLFPSLYDASSIVVIEAATHKLPSLLIKGATTAEKILDNHNGFLTENNAEKYAEKIIELLKNPTLLKECGENACNELSLKWKNIIKSVRERYEIVIENYKTKK